MEKKYVRLEYSGFILFTEAIPHMKMKEIAKALNEMIVSAGFWSTVNGSRAICYGESIGLRIASKPEDTELLRKFLGENDVS